MDPHSPYLPPVPFDRIFYHGDETNPRPPYKSMKPVMDFKPFRDYFATWMPPGCTDKDYMIAQYDGAVAYMDACIANIFAQLNQLGIEEETLVVIDSETLLGCVMVQNSSGSLGNLRDSGHHSGPNELACVTCSPVSRGNLLDRARMGTYGI